MTPDVICAPATSSLKSAVHIVRVTGRDLIRLLQPLLPTLPLPRQITLLSLAWTLNGLAYTEQALVVYFAAPNTYTGEDLLEFHLHGNPLLTQRFMDYLLSLGVRMAVPGEFTQRALINNKKNLLDVETLRDLMDAQTDVQLRQAQAQQGGLPLWVKTFQAELAPWIAQAEASVDYGDDEHVVLDHQALTLWAQQWSERLQETLLRASSAQWIKKGIHILLVGRPNAGKSTLFNYLLGQSRALVSEQPGTTRDYLEGTTEWAGLPLVVMDTAGVRDAAETLEAQGIAMIEPLLLRADLILHLVPIQDTEPDLTVTEFLKPYAKKVCVLRTMADRGNPPSKDLAVSVHQQKLEPLKNYLMETFLRRQNPESLLGAFSDERQLGLLQQCLQTLMMLAQLDSGAPSEIRASALQGLWASLAQLLGDDPVESALDQMFSRFCLGK